MASPRDQSGESPRERFTIVLADTPGDSRPAVIRLRQFLKLAGRELGLRCVSIVSGDGKAVQP